MSAISSAICPLRFIVYAENEVGARTKAVDQLRLPGLKFAQPLMPDRRFLPPQSIDELDKMSQRERAITL